MEPDAGSIGEILAIHFLTCGWRSIWLRLNRFHSLNDHVPGAILQKCVAGRKSGTSPTWSVKRAMVAAETSLGTGATISGAVSNSANVPMVWARVAPVQDVWMNWRFSTPERYPRELMTLFWASDWMAMIMRSSAVHVASSQGMNNPARAGTD